MRRPRKTPHGLGYRFYRGYIYRRVGSGDSDRMNLWNSQGRFVCTLSLRLLPRYVDKSIKFGWEKVAVAATEFEQFDMFKKVA